MTSPIRTVVVLDKIDDSDVLPSLPTGGAVEIVTIVEGVDDAADMLLDTPCDAVLVACSGYSERVLLFTETAVRVDPNRPVIVLAQGSPNGFVRRVFEVGADDIVSLPQPSDAVRFVVEKAIARKQSAATRRRSGGLGRLIVVLGPKGGTGKTLTATNLSVALQQAGMKIALVDLDLQFGDVALCMGLAPERTIHDLAVDQTTFDSQTLDRYLMRHDSGVRALIAPSRPDQAGAVTVEAVREIYAVLRSEYDAVVVDTPPGFTPEVIASIDMSTDLVMVGTLDSLSLKNTKLGLETLELMHYDPEAVHVVLNRAHSRVGISTDTVTRVLGRAPDVLVPSDREVPLSVNEGVPIVLSQRRSECAEAFVELAGLFRDEDAPTLPEGGPPEAEPVAEPAGRRLFGRRG